MRAAEARLHRMIPGRPELGCILRLSERMTVNRESPDAKHAIVGATREVQTASILMAPGCL